MFEKHAKYYLLIIFMHIIFNKNPDDEIKKDYRNSAGRYRRR